MPPLLAACLLQLVLVGVGAALATGVDASAQGDDTSLLQVSLGASRRERAGWPPWASPESDTIWRPPSGPTAFGVPALRGRLPVELVHSPKTGGTSFLNVLIHLPGACASLPPDPRKVGHVLRNMKIPEEWGCNLAVVDLTWPRMQHAGIEFYPLGGFQANRGRYMTMMRQPEQRLLSHYYFDVRDWGYTKTLEEYLPLRTGCYVRMLTGDLNWSTCDDSDVPLSRAEIDEAIARLRTGFSFIGITDKWNLSMCLFNAMFSQPCQSYQFWNVRPTVGNSSTEYDVSVLKGYRDEIDHELYNVGLELFEADLKRHGVSESSCEPCWRAAGVI